VTSEHKSTRAIRSGATTISSLAALFVSSLTCGDPLPVSAFAQRPEIADAKLSPDGRYVAYLAATRDERTLVVLDRRNQDKRAVISRLGRASGFDIAWCDWANEMRLLCSVRGASIEAGDAAPLARLFAINADGSDVKSLSNPGALPNDRTANVTRIGPGGAARRQDRVVDLTPAQRESVLVQVEDYYGYSTSVLELNIYTGSTRVHEPAFPPINDFATDPRGNVRLGRGYRPGETRYSYFVRSEGSKEWRLFMAHDLFERPEGFSPERIGAGNRLYAFEVGAPVRTLWELDLQGGAEPQRLSDLGVEARRALFAKDKRLVGIEYETDRPFARYTDERVRSVIDGANRFLSDSYNDIYDSTPDEQVFIVRSRSDVDAGSFHLLDVSTGSGDLERLGVSYPKLDPTQLARLQTIHYQARDGTKISGYLTLPPNTTPQKLPVVILPHDGPGDRDSWEFDYLRLFLASRGYAVVQMNYRGSAGYGWDWERTADQDWAGVTYDDISDAARWASAQAFADPHRICITGSGFGGYMALVGAMRNEGLFRCAISIGGISDLGQWKDDAKYSFAARIIAKLVGDGRKKGNADSPARDAEDVRIPVLLIHGTHDWGVGVAHTKRLAAALKLKRKPHDVVIIDGAEHDFRWESERETLLQAIESFLAKNLQ
jgi:dienelactone hydrolase